MNGKRPFKSMIQVGNKVPLSDLRQYAVNDPTEFLGKVQRMADEGKLRLKDFDLKELYRTFADVEVTVPVDIHGMKRAITTSAMPILTGTMVVAGINDAYAAVETIGQELVTEQEDNKKVTTVAVLDATDSNITEVKETGDFPEIGINEEGVEIRHKKNGRRLNISVEAFLENDLFNIERRINMLGEIPAEWIEEQTLRRVTDYDGSKASPGEPYVYRPTTGGTALFSATANTPGTRAPSGTRINSNAFVDETDLEAARIRLAAMKNIRSRRIMINRSEVKILCPDAIVGKVLKVANSEFVPGVENEVSNFGPNGKFHIPKERIISSPKLDDLSATAWYYGAPQKQFIRKWKMMLEYVSLGQNTQLYLTNQIAFQARVAWDVEIGAVDYVYWIQNLAATTAPADA
jgi:hypothetical protein